MEDINNKEAYAFYNVFKDSFERNSLENPEMVEYYKWEIKNLVKTMKTKK